MASTPTTDPLDGMADEVATPRPRRKTTARTHAEVRRTERDNELLGQLCSAAYQTRSSLTQPTDADALMHLAVSTPERIAEALAGHYHADTWRWWWQMALQRDRVELMPIFEQLGHAWTDDDLDMALFMQEQAPLCRDALLAKPDVVRSGLAAAYRATPTRDIGRTSLATVARRMDGDTLVRFLDAVPHIPQPVLDDALRACFHSGLARRYDRQDTAHTMAGLPRIRDALVAHGAHPHAQMATKTTKNAPAPARSAYDMACALLFDMPSNHAKAWVTWLTQHLPGSGLSLPLACVEEARKINNTTSSLASSERLAQACQAMQHGAGHWPDASHPDWLTLQNAVMSCITARQANLLHKILPDLPYCGPMWTRGHVQHQLVTWADKIQGEPGALTHAVWTQLPWLAEQDRDLWATGRECLTELNAAIRLRKEKPTMDNIAAMERLKTEMILRLSIDDNGQPSPKRMRL